MNQSDVKKDDQKETVPITLNGSGEDSPTIRLQDKENTNGEKNWTNDNKNPSGSLTVDNSQTPEPEYTESPYRFVIVIVYFLLNFANGTQWVTYASTAHKFRQNYELNRLLVDLFSMIFMIEYPFLCVPEAYIIDNVSMRLGLSLAAFTTIFGAFLKIFTNKSLAWAYLGQVLSGSFQPAILNSPAKIASVWFKDSSRALVTSICCVANTVGVWFGYIYHTFFMDEDSVGQKYKDEFYDYVFWEFILVLILCLPTFFFMYSKPAKPTSKSQDQYKSPPLKESLKILLKNKSFVKFLICSTCIIGFFNTYGTILNPYLALYSISDDDASYSAAAANGFGIVACWVVSSILDQTKKFRKMMLLLNVLGWGFMILLTIWLEVVNTHPFVISIVCFSLVVSMIVPIYTTGMDYVCEWTYPVGESISGGWLMCCNQISGIVWILIADLLIHNVTDERYLTNIMSILLFIGSLISIWFIDEKLVRNENEKANVESEGKEQWKGQNKEAIHDSNNKKIKIKILLSVVPLL